MTEKNRRLTVLFKSNTQISTNVELSSGEISKKYQKNQAASNHLEKTIQISFCTDYCWTGERLSVK